MPEMTVIFAVLQLKKMYHQTFCLAKFFSHVTISRADLYDTCLSPTPQHLHGFCSDSRYFPGGY